MTLKPESPARVVIKLGTGILANPEGTLLDESQFTRLTTEVAVAVESGVQIIMVSSGAVAAGLDALGLSERPESLSARQACAAVGQCKLMESYSRHFALQKLHVAQLLLTYKDLDSRTAYENARNTLSQLFQSGRIVPIVNENDSVAVEELRFGDNDRLSAEVALLAGASKLIILTSVDGLLDANGQTVPVVEKMEKAEGLVRNEKGRLSVGGMQSKLQAVSVAVNAGITTHIASGRKPGQIGAILKGESAGTCFPAGS